MIVVIQLVRHFSVRRFEWFMALAFVSIGWAFAAPGETFANSRSYDMLAHWASEDTWATVLIWTGLVSCVVLFVNGVVLRRAAEIRALLGIWRFSIVVMMALALNAGAAEPSTLAGLLTLMAGFELSNIWTAVVDAHDRRQEMKNVQRTGKAS